MENSLLTGFLFPKIIAENYNLEDQNNFIITSFLIDKMSDNKSFSMMFQLLTAKNAETKKEEPTLVVTNPTIDVPADPPKDETPDPSEDQPKEDEPKDDQPKDDQPVASDDTTNEDVKKTVVAKLDTINSSINKKFSEIRGHVEPIKTVHTEVTELKGYITKPKDAFENQEIAAVFDAKGIDVKEFRNSMYVDYINDVIEEIKSDKFKTNLEKITKSNAELVKPIKTRVTKFSVFFDIDFLKKLKETFESTTDLSMQDMRIFISNVISPLLDLVRDIKYFDFPETESEVAPKATTPRATKASKTSKTKVTT